MSQHYSDPSRAEETYSLPDVETFEVGAWTPAEECPHCFACDETYGDHNENCFGFYWQSCFPGCLPDSDPFGPFATEAEAVADAQDQE